MFNHEKHELHERGIRAGTAAEFVSTDCADEHRFSRRWNDLFPCLERIVGGVPCGKGPCRIFYAFLFWGFLNPCSITGILFGM